MRFRSLLIRLQTFKIEQHFKFIFENSGNTRDFMAFIVQTFDDVSQSILSYTETLDRLRCATLDTIWSRCESLFEIPRRFYEVCISYSTMTSLRLHRDYLDKKRQQLEESYPHLFEYVKVPSSQNTVLDGIVLRHPSHKNEGFAIVVLWGIKGCYENDFDRLLELSNTFEMDVISINYRGVGRSTGFPVGTKDLLDDAESMIHWANKYYDIPFEKLLVYGTSMGGALGLDIVASFAKKGQKLHLLSDRSFSTYFDVVKANAKRLLGDSWVFGEFFCKVAEFAGWSIDSKKNLIRVMESDVDSRIVVIYHPEDTIIPYDASLGKSAQELMDNQFLKKEHLVTVIKLDESRHPLVHSCKITDRDFSKQVERCREIFHNLFGIGSFQSHASASY